MKILDLDELDLTAHVRPGDCVMWGQAGAEPVSITRKLMAQRHGIGKFEVFLGASWSDTANPLYADCIGFRSYCGAGENRRLAQAGVLDILPSHYSELAAMIRSGRLKVDVLMLQLAPADTRGRFSLSIAHEYLLPAIASARVLIAEINDQAPWTYGERTLGAADIGYAVYTSRAPVRAPPIAVSAVESRVAARVAGLIEDGCTLQFGIGALPGAVLMHLKDRRDLGVHTGALVDQAAELARLGVVTNARKSIDRGVTIAGVMMGGRAVYEYAAGNERVQFRSVEYTHSARVLAGIDRFVAINSAIEVDLSGQINSEVAAGCYVGAVGGAQDFLRGAHHSFGGLPIVALPSASTSRAAPGSAPGESGGRVSRIVAALSGPASAARADAGLIVTEHGIADLRGMSLRQRAAKMLSIADPEFRDALERSYRERTPPRSI